MKRSRNCGFTLLETLIASTLLAALLILMLSISTTGTESYSFASTLVDTQVLLHRQLEGIFGELLESNPGYIWVSTFADPLRSGQNRQAITYVSARSKGGQFVVSNGSPSWQSVVTYCPYTWTDIDGTKIEVLRRYEYTGAPSAYTDESFAFTFAATTTQLTMPNGVTFTRSGGEKILDNLKSFSVTGTYPLRLSITTTAKSLSSQTDVPLTAELAGRNMN